jgi:hypothetical protein
MSLVKIDLKSNKGEKKVDLKQAIDISLAPYDR